MCQLEVKEDKLRIHKKPPGNVWDVLYKSSSEDREGGPVQGSRGAGTALCFPAKLRELCNPGINRTESEEVCPGGKLMQGFKLSYSIKVLEFYIDL